MAQSTVGSINKNDINNGKVPAKETILSPRFYTTDFEAMENMDLSIKITPPTRLLLSQKKTSQ